MKKWMVWSLLLVILSAGMAVWLVPKKMLRNLYLYVRSEKFVERKTEPVLATFDWNTKNLKANKDDSFQYVNFRISDSRTKVPPAIKELSTSRPVFITVDMWNDFISENPLESVIRGKYDQKIREICGHFQKSDHVYIRWNAEMEVPAKKYPWQGQSPLLYNEAFRYFSSFCRKLLPQAKIVWSTAGYPGVLEYYPGSDVIDYISVTLQSPSEKSTKAYPDYKSVSDEVIRKIHRMRFIEKPLLILKTDNLPVQASVSAEIAAAAKYIQGNTETIYQTLTADNTISLVRKDDSSIQIGVYDPNARLSQLPEVTTEHLFPNFKDLQDSSFYKSFNDVVARKHDVIVTFEPWKDRNVPADPFVLQNILNGRYDGQINALFRIISKTDQTVYLRWTHEMEIPITRYPWQSQPPVDYIKAYRYVASFRKSDNINIKFVWGPAGDRGLQDWWPGGDVVDYISMAIYGLPDKNITDHKQQESFKTIFNRKAYRMRLFQKPIFITEFGIKGPEEFQREWLLSASETISKHPEIKGVSYFNMVDSPKAWGNIEAPDWSISEETFRDFIKSLNITRRTPAIAFQ